MSSPQQPPPDPQAAQAGLAILVGLAASPGCGRRWTCCTCGSRCRRSRRRCAGGAAARAGVGDAGGPAVPPAAGRRGCRGRVHAPPGRSAVGGAGRAGCGLGCAAAVERRTCSRSGSAHRRPGRRPSPTRRPAWPPRRSGWCSTPAGTRSSATSSDRKAKGWARIPEPGACSSALMLATRGAVYRSEKGGDFKSHDNCRCHVEPVFTAYEPSAQVRSPRRPTRRAVYEALKAKRRSVTSRQVRPHGRTRHGSRSGRPSRAARRPQQ
jgi:hypothetical protein